MSYNNQENLSTLFQNFNECVDDLSSQNIQILKLMMDCKNEFQNPKKKFKIDQQSEIIQQAQQEIQLLQDELRTYKNFHVNFTNLVDQIEQGHKKQIDNIKVQLVDTQTLENAYLDIVKDQQQKIKQAHDKIEDLQIQFDQQVKINQDQAIELKDKNRLLELRQIFDQGDLIQTSNQKSNSKINQKMASTIQKFKKLLKQSHQQNQQLRNIMICQQNQNQTNDAELQFWKENCQDLEDQVQTTFKQIAQLRSELQQQKSLNRNINQKQKLKRKTTLKQNQSPQGGILITLLEENQKLRQDLKELKFKQDLNSAINISGQSQEIQNHENSNLEENDINYIKLNWNKIEKYILLSKFHEEQ